MLTWIDEWINYRLFRSLLGGLYPSRGVASYRFCRYVTERDS